MNILNVNMYGYDVLTLKLLSIKKCERKEFGMKYRAYFSRFFTTSTASTASYAHASAPI